MKKLMLVASLCIAAFVAVPLASANAAVFKGECNVEGQATFEKGLLERETQTLGYEFEAKEGEVKCTEETTETKYTGKATVKGGEFKGSCLKPGVATKDGEGKLELEAGTKVYEFDLDFTTENGKVSLKVEKPKGAEEDKVTATGEATFFKSKKQLAVLCLITGVKELQFEATIKGAVG